MLAWLFYLLRDMLTPVVDVFGGEKLIRSPYVIF
jgi:hypothetical protein